MKKMVNNIFLIIAIALTTLLATSSSCRDAYDSPYSEVEPWDAGDSGNGQPAAPCTEGALFSFNNDFSPFYRGEISVDV